jgi:hypothetical protein
MFVNAAAAVLDAPNDADAKVAALSRMAIEFVQASRRRFCGRVREAEKRLIEFGQADEFDPARPSQWRLASAGPAYRLS